MPLSGFTSAHYPGRVFTYPELMALLDRPNLTSYTPALLEKALAFKGDHPEDLSATGLTGTCPREAVLRRQVPYTLEIENMGYALQSVHLRDMLAQAPARPNTFRDVEVWKRIPLSEVDAVPLPARIDEVVTGEFPLLRIYKPTHRMPDKRGPYPLHRLELAVYRLLLSNFQGLPVVSNGPESPEIYDFAEGEVVYIHGDQVRRFNFPLDPPGATITWLRPMLMDMTAAQPVSFETAVSENGYGMGWKCPFCPVQEQCHAARRVEAQAAKPQATDPYEI